MRISLGRGAELAADDVLTVECARENAGDGGLADAAVAGEDVAVRDAVPRERVQERTGDVILSNDVSEAKRAVLAG